MCTFLAGAQQRTDPYEPAPVVSFKGTPASFPTYGTSKLCVLCADLRSFGLAPALPLEGALGTSIWAPPAHRSNETAWSGLLLLRINLQLECRHSHTHTHTLTHTHTSACFLVGADLA